MNYKAVGWSVVMVLTGATGANAADTASMDGLALYNKECSVCHSVMTHTKTGELPPIRSRQRPESPAIASAGGLTPVDFQIPLTSDRPDAGAVPEMRQPHAVTPDRVAVVPIYGPPLRGIVGRVAATSERYTYSKSFMEKMEGVTWDEAKLDTWLKSSQTMVPGSYMFYSQKNPDFRRRIVEYLKTQTE